MMTDQDWADQDAEYAADCEASPESPALDPASPDQTAWDRAETDPCERGTVGCSVRHTGDTECQTW
jgi:hypothetical protein